MSAITKNVLVNLQTASATARRSSIGLSVRGQEVVNRIKASNEIERSIHTATESLKRYMQLPLHYTTIVLFAIRF